MNDYYDELEKYKDIKEFADLKEEVKKLREYYHNCQFDKMQQHIQSLMLKYPFETLTWNSGHPVPPQTDEQLYLNAESFLHAKYQALLVKKGINLKKAR